MARRWSVNYEKKLIADCASPHACTRQLVPGTLWDKRYEVINDLRPEATGGLPFGEISTRRDAHSGTHDHPIGSAHIVFTCCPPRSERKP